MPRPIDPSRDLLLRWLALLAYEAGAALRASVRRHRRAQRGSPMLRSIRPTRARRPFDASVDPTEARNARVSNTLGRCSACHDKPSYWPLKLRARE